VTRKGPGHYTSLLTRLLQNIFVGEQVSNDFPLSSLRNPRRDTAMPENDVDEEMERHLCVVRDAHI
jgi:voltage-dependent calcium channel